MSQMENTRKQSLIAMPGGSGGTETWGLNLLRRLTTLIDNQIVFMPG